MVAGHSEAVFLLNCAERKKKPQNKITIKFFSLKLKV